MNRRRHLPPPFWFLAALAVMAALHRFLPLGHLLAWPWRWLGLVPLLGGVALGASALGRFKAAGTAYRPGSAASALVTSGPYRLTRNPMYLGLTLLLLGAALLAGTVSPWLVVPLFVGLLDRRFVVVEEARLAETFGAEFAAYRQRVRRWL